MTSHYTDEFAQINGCRLHYQDWGDKGADVNLMVHGLTQQSHTFDAVANRIHSRTRCIALDVRGRGQSDWSGGETYAHRQYIEDIVELMAELKISRWHYMGTSMGGQIGMMLAAKQPDKFLSMVINDIGPEINPVGAQRIGAYVKAVPTSFPDFDACVDWSIKQYPWLQGIPRDAVKDSVQWAVIENGGERDKAGWRFRFDPAIIQGAPTDPGILKKASGKMWDGLKALQCPVLLVRGADTDILHEDVARAMVREQSRLTRVDVPGMGHAPTMSEPVVQEALDSFYA